MAYGKKMKSIKKMKLDKMGNNDGKTTYADVILARKKSAAKKKKK